MKSLDLSKFKKASSGDNHTVFEHPDGHKIFVSHKALKPGQRADLGKLAAKEESAPEQPVQKFAHGGAAVPEALSPQAAPPDALNPQAQFAIPMSAPQGPVATPVPSDTLTQYMSNPYMGGFDSKGFQDIQHRPFASADKIATEATADNQPKAPGQDDAPSNYPLGQGPQASSGAGLGMPQMPGVPGKLRQGIQNEANAMGAMGNEQAQAGQDFDRQMQDMQATQAQHEQAIHAEREAFKSDLANQHIDPNHYIGSKSTGGKIATAIGLILGGIGGGLTGKENPAAKFLQDQISKDVEAQKANMDNKKSLYAANLDELKDARAADNMTRIQLNDMYAHKIATIAQKYQDPIAQARAQQTLGMIEAQNRALAGQTAQTMAVKQALATGAMKPSEAIPYLVPKEHQAKAFEQAGKMESLEELRTQTNENAKQLRGMAGNGAFSPNTRQSLIGPLAARLEKLGEGRYNHDAAVQIMEGFFPARSDMGENTWKTKSEQANKFFDSLQAENKVLEGYGIHMPKPKDNGFTKRK